MLKRIWSLFVGFITFGMVKLEESNPEMLLENLNRKIDDKIHNARSQIIKVKVNLKIAEKQVSKAQDQVNSIQRSIQAAINAKDEELLVQLYLREKEYQKTYDMSKKLFDDIKAHFEKAEGEYKVFKAELESKKLSIEAFKAQSHISKMRKDMLQVMDVEFSEIDFGQVEKIIDKQSFEVEAIQELQEESVESKIRKISVNADVEEARAKAKMAIMG